MTRRRATLLGIGLVVLASAGWAVTRVVMRTDAGATVDASAPETLAPPPGVPRITVTLFYGAPTGDALLPVRREIALSEGLVPQGRAIVTALLQRPPSPYLTVIPERTRLRAFHVTERGDAFVDLSPEVSSRHPGGSTTELLTVYAVVNSLTANLPKVRRVQILIDGQEVDTLAGHVDLRNPLERDRTFERSSTAAP